MLIQHKHIALSLALDDTFIDIADRTIFLHPGFSQDAVNEITPEILKDTGLVIIAAETSSHASILTSLSGLFSKFHIPTYLFIEKNEHSQSPFIHPVEGVKKPTVSLKGKALLESLKNKKAHAQAPQSPVTEHDFIKNLSPYLERQKLKQYIKPNQYIIITTPSIATALSSALSSRIGDLAPVLKQNITKMIELTNGRRSSIDGKARLSFSQLIPRVDIQNTEDPNKHHYAEFLKAGPEQTMLIEYEFDVVTRESKHYSMILPVDYDEITAITRTHDTITLYGDIAPETLNYPDKQLVIECINDSNPIIPFSIKEEEPVPTRVKVIDLNAITVLSNKAHHLFRSVKFAILDALNTYDEVILNINSETKSLLWDTMILWDGAFDKIFIENGYRPSENHTPPRISVFENSLLWSIEPDLRAWSAATDTGKKEAIFSKINNTLSAFITQYAEHLNDKGADINALIENISEADPAEIQLYIDTFRGTVLPDYWTQLWSKHIDDNSKEPSKTNRSKHSDDNSQESSKTKRLIIVSDSSNLSALTTLRESAVPKKA